MSHNIARLVIIATTIALAACTSPTSPTSADCGGGNSVGSGSHC